MKAVKNSKMMLLIAVVAVVVVGAALMMGQYQAPYTTPQQTTTPRETVPETQPAAQQPAPAKETAPAPPAFSVTVATEKPSYKADQNIKISGTSLPETSITLEVTNQFGTTTRTRLLTTDANGNYEDNFKFGSKTTKGTYTVKATASKSGYETVTATTTFELTL